MPCRAATAVRELTRRIASRTTRTRTHTHTYLEGLSDIGKVGDTTTDQEGGPRLRRLVDGIASGEVQHGSRIVVGLLLVGSTAVLAVVALQAQCKLVRQP